jgi:hypothetical protein
VSDSAASSCPSPSDTPERSDASVARHPSRQPDPPAQGEWPERSESPLPLPELETRITELAGHLNAAGHRWLLLVAEFDRRQGWADGATRSCAHWLGWKCGIDLGAAREKVRVGRALEALPAIGAAMARGALSYSKVRALTRVATPETEDTLLMIALHGTAHHVEAVVRGFRRARQSVEHSRQARQTAERGVRWHHDDDGSLVMQVRLPAETGALVLQALQGVMDGDGSTDARPSRANHVPAGTGDDSRVSAPASDVPAGTPADSPLQRRADALVRLAESWLAHGDRPLPGGERQQIVVHVDLATLATDSPGRCGLQDGPTLAAETVRRLGCDASLLAIVEDGQGRVLDVGRRTRSIPPAIGRALRARDRGCRYPGCTHTRFVDGHHIEHWAHGGATRLSNLVLLCRRHHRQVHEGGNKVRMLDDGAIVFSDALGRRIEPAPPLEGEAGWIAERHREARLPIDAGTAGGHWRGERLDLGLAVGGLLAQQAAARSPPPLAAAGLPPLRTAVG